MSRIAFLHTGAVVIPTFSALADDLLTGSEVQHLLDGKIVADIGAGHTSEEIAARLAGLGHAAVRSGADSIVLTCSSISGYAAGLSADTGLPVHRIDEAMADEAVRRGPRIGVVATLRTTLDPTVALIGERAAAASAEVEITTVVVDGAFAAVTAGDTAEHDRLVAAAITELAERSDVVALAQASMAGAAAASDTSTPVLSSPELGLRRLAGLLAAPSREHG